MYRMRLAIVGIARLALTVMVAGFLGAAAASVTDVTIAEARAADATTGEAPAAIAQSAFPVLPGLKIQVEFWEKIFAVYSTRQVVIHDALHLNRIYAVLDFRPLAESGASDAEVAAYTQQKVRYEKERVRAILLRLHQLGADSEGLSAEERKIWTLFANVKDPSKFLHAAADDRLRTQPGLRERFAAGLEVSRRYLPEMEAIFRREGLPVELTRLPLVESCFNVRAYSKVGAAGIWQFMPATGRLYMRVNDAVDERRDPILSTVAAAQHLKQNYDVLGTWPLAITAYNHGRAGMVRATETVGSADLVEIIKRYHGPAFKFASRNFYAEFVAALEVERHFEDYFGELRPHSPMETESVLVPDYVSLQALARATNTDVDTLVEYNPALAREVIAGKLYVPKGYRLRVPAGAAATFRTRYTSVPSSQRYARQRTLYVTHRVKRGQTLSTIAKRYGTTEAAIRRQNNLRGAGRVRVGQSLIIPAG